MAPRPAYGHSQDRRPDLKQVLLSLGVSNDGGVPLRLGIREGHTRESTETPVAIEECLALGFKGVISLVAASKASSQRPLGRWVEQHLGLVPLVPRPGLVRQELASGGQQQAPSSQLAAQQARAYATAQGQEAERGAEHLRRVAARSFACAADAEAAVAQEEGRGQGQRGRWPQHWRYHARHSRVESFRQRQKRGRRGRPAKAESPCRSHPLLSSGRSGGRHPS